MRIKDITENQQARVRKVAGNEVEIDHGDGVTTTIDTRQNPNALQKDPRTGRVSVNRNNSQQNKPNSRTTVKPGDKIDPESLDDED